MKGLLVLLAAGAGAAIYFLSKKSDNKAPSAEAANQPAPDAPELKGSEVGPIAFVFTDPKFTASVAEKVRQAVQVKYLIDGGKNIPFFVARTTSQARTNPKAKLTGAQKYFTQIIGLVPPVLDGNMSRNQIAGTLIQTVGTLSPNERMVLIMPPSAGDVLDTWLEDLSKVDVDDAVALCRVFAQVTPVVMPVSKDGQYIFDERAKDRILKVISGGPSGLTVCQQYLASKNA